MAAFAAATVVVWLKYPPSVAMCARVICWIAVMGGVQSLIFIVVAPPAFFVVSPGSPRATEKCCSASTRAGNKR